MRRRHTALGRTKKTLLVAVALMSAVLFMFPTVLTICNSFMSQSEINSSYGSVFESSGSSDSVTFKLIPGVVSLDQYATTLFQSPDYLLKFWNSVILVLPIVLFQIALALLAAYSFFRFRGKHKEIILFVYTILMLMPYQVTMVPNYIVSQGLDILNTRSAIWLPGITAPFSVFLLTKFMRRIPESYIEAAKLDGAGNIRIFFQICLPMCKSVVVSVAILVFIDYWNMVEQPLILLSDSSLYPLSVFLSQINTGELGLAFAVSTIYMIPPLLIFLGGEEHLVAGITYSGGMKG